MWCRNLRWLVVPWWIVASGGTAVAHGPIVAVFDIQASRLRLSRAVRAALSEYLVSKLAASGAYQIVPRDQLRQRLRQQKRRSYKTCYAQSCQIAIGKELAAQKSLATKVMRIGRKCVVTVALYDLRSATTEGGANASGGCNEDGLMASIDAVAAKLTRRRTTPRSTAPATPRSTAPATPRSTAPAAPRVTAVQILRQAARAAGGLARIKRIKTLLIVGRTSDGLVRMLYQRPARAQLMTLSGRRSRSRRTYRRLRCSERGGGLLASAGARFVRRRFSPKQCVAQVWPIWPWILDNALRGKIRMQVVKAPEAGQNAVELFPPGGGPEKLVFDRAGRLVQQGDCVLSNHRRVAGVVMPFRSVCQVGGTTTYSKIQFNVPVKPSAFQ